MRKAKKLMSLIMTAALTVTALPVTALAADAGGGSIPGEGEVVGSIVYSVDVPTDLLFKINPYGYDYTLPAPGTGTSSEQIVSTGYGFGNDSSMPIQVDVKVEFVSADGIKIVSSPDEIKNTADEERTLYMEMQPGAASADYDGTDVPIGSNFMSGSAIGTTGTTMSFKLNEAEYSLTAANTMQKDGNNNTGDGVYFRFGGKASMYSDWTGRKAAVEATYTYNCISRDDYADPDNEVVAGSNVLKESLVKKGPSIALTANNVLTLTASDDYKTGENYNIQKMFFVVSADGTPINLSAMTLTDEAITPNATNGGYTVLEFDYSIITCDPVAGTVTFTPAGMNALDNVTCAFFIKIADTNGNITIASSPSLTMHK